ncbi:MAG: polyprenyl synthetase family protein [Phycisphaerae bacterium]|nr:polyprenyl synthetase family protein [Phycisphaerae bacterium]
MYNIIDVREFLCARLDCPEDKLAPFVDYLKEQQGKMLRASSLLLSGKLAGKLNPVHIKLAAVVEMVHAATLLHDDVIDDGSKRRFRATANNLWGANFAVLLGDYLLSKAFEIVATIQRSDISLLFAQMAQTICRGEMLQNAFGGDFSVTIEQYIEIISKKTAVFFADCCRLGAMACGADKNICERLYESGMNFGICFQIADDLVDICGSEEKTGKTVGRDFKSKILTMPIVYAISKLSPAAKNELMLLLDSDRPDTGKILAALRAAKSIEYTESRIEYYRQKALDQIASFGNLPAEEELKNLVLSATTVQL